MFGAQMVAQLGLLHILGSRGDTHLLFATLIHGSGPAADIHSPGATNFSTCTCKSAISRAWKQSIATPAPSMLHQVSTVRCMQM